MKRSATDLSWEQNSGSPDYCRSSRIVGYKAIASGAVPCTASRALAGRVSRDSRLLGVCRGDNRVNCARGSKHRHRFRLGPCLLMCTGFFRGISDERRNSFDTRKQVSGSLISVLGTRECLLSAINLYVMAVLYDQYVYPSAHLTQLWILLHSA